MAKKKAVVEATEGVLDALMAPEAPEGPGAPQQEVDNDVATVTEGPPPVNSPDWTPYVLSKLNPDEVFDNCPTYPGIDRLTESLLGVVVSTKVTVNQSPNPQNGNHSAVTVDMVIDHPVEFTWLGARAGRVINYSNASDVFSANGSKGEDFFSYIHSLATCTSRTKARVLREAFKLRGVYLREEVSEAEPGDPGTDGTMNGVQAKVLETAGKRLNLNAAEHLRDQWRKADPNRDGGYEDLNEVPHFVAGRAVAALQKWQHKDNAKQIPEPLRGYQQEWVKGLRCLK